MLEFPQNKEKGKYYLDVFNGREILYNLLIL